MRALVSSVFTSTLVPSDLLGAEDDDAPAAAGPLPPAAAASAVVHKLLDPREAGGSVRPSQRLRDKAGTGSQEKLQTT